MTSRIGISCTRSAIALSLLLLCVSQQALADKRAFSIDSQDASRALMEFGRQAGLQILFASEHVKGFTTNAVSGDYEPIEAIRLLIKNTGLVVSEKADGVLIVEPQKSALQDGRNDTLNGGATRADADIRLAQAVTPGDEQKQAAPKDEGAKEEEIQLEEVVVTGTHIRGGPSAGSRVITLGRDFITKSGYATVEGLLKTLPQNFGGGIGQAQAPQLGDQGDSANFNEGTAINLRGLGADSTLVLVDGRRQPAGGLKGAFVDISSIPVSAIERVEILPDGASALYGSDAVGGVVNFILRKNFDGAESQVRFGDAQGGADEVQVSQLFGHSWSSGNALIGYQYDDRDNLQRNQRAFSASDDLTPLGGSDYRSIFSNPTNILDPATEFSTPAYAIPTGQDGTSLQAGDLLPGVVNYDASSSAADLYADQRMHSAFLNATQRLSDRFEVFANGRFASRRHTMTSTAASSVLVVPSSNPFFVDPFGGSDFIVVAYNLANDLGLPVTNGRVETSVGTVGATVQLPASWDVSFSGTYGHEKTRLTSSNLADTAALDSALADPNPATAFNPFGDGSNTPAGTLAAIRATNVLEADATARNANAIFTGPLFRLGDASSRLALGADFRDEEVRLERSFANDVQPGAKFDRRVKAAFAELALPLVTSGSHVALRELSMSLAARYEDYSDFGATFDQRAGVTWKPAESLKARASWGTSFKAPRLHQLVTGYPDSADFLTELFSPDGPVNALVRLGNNPNLTEETADVWSAGVDWTPSAMPSFNASLTFWRIEYTDRVAPAGPAGNPFGILFEADEWAEAINSDPTRAEVDAICRGPSLVFTPLDQCLATMPQAVVDLRLTNLALVKVEGVDVEGRYRFDTHAGAITLGLNGVYMPHYDRQATDRSPEVDVSNTTGNVLRLRLRGEASWSRGGWDITTFVNYANRYEDTFSVSGRPIKAWTTVDGTVSYRFEDSGAVFGGLTVALHALNLFDRDPPFANVGSSDYAYGYDTTNADSFGRVLSLQVSKVWGQAD